MRVLVADKFEDSGIQGLRAVGCEVIYEPKLEGDALAWTPGDDEVGGQTASVRVFSGKVERIVEVALSVARPRVALGFAPQDVRLAPDGSALVAFRAADRVRGGEGDAPKNEIAVRDLGTGDETARRSLVAAVGAIGIDDHFVYAALADSDAFYVLKRQDLSDVKRLFTNGRVKEFAPFGKEVLLALCENGSVATFKRTADGVEPLALPGLGGGMDRMGRPSIRWLGEDRLVSQGALYEGTLDKPKAVVDAGPWVAKQHGEAALEAVRRGEVPAKK